MNLTVTTNVSFGGRRRRCADDCERRSTDAIGRTPRISRLMAMAIHMDRLLREGVVSDRAELARLSYVSRARITQIMNMNFLAPDLQEEILFLPRVTKGRDPIRDHAVRKIALIPEWGKQRRMWRELRAERG